eukprot:159675-Rhodomonas_salina.3
MLPHFFIRVRPCRTMLGWMMRLSLIISPGIPGVGTSGGPVVARHPWPGKLIACTALPWKWQQIRTTVKAETFLHISPRETMLRFLRKQIRSTTPAKLFRPEKQMQQPEQIKVLKKVSEGKESENERDRQGQRGVGNRAAGGATIVPRVATGVTTGPGIGGVEGTVPSYVPVTQPLRRVSLRPVSVRRSESHRPPFVTVSEPRHCQQYPLLPPPRLNLPDVPRLSRSDIIPGPPANRRDSLRPRVRVRERRAGQPAAALSLRGQRHTGKPETRA